jgi:hypothetical protein
MQAANMGRQFKQHWSEEISKLLQFFLKREQI